MPYIMGQPLSSIWPWPGRESEGSLLTLGRLFVYFLATEMDFTLVVYKQVQAKQTMLAGQI